MPASIGRRGYLDWLRGLAVLIMIEAHVLDSWTRLDDRESLLYDWSMILGGFGAPLFLLLAGVSVALSAGSKARRTGNPSAASRTVTMRGLWIFALAFLFRLQAMVVSWGSWRSLLKVDILNVMGPAIMGAAWLWGAMRTSRGRAFAFLAVTLGFAFLTPPVRSIAVLSVLPDPIEAYLRPRPGYTTFSLFPWAGFLFAGALVGVFLDETRTGAAERRLNIRLGAAGVALALGAYGASYLPSPYERSDFWTSSPSFFLLRAGVLVAAIGAAYAWHQRPALAREGVGWSPLQQMGRTSLFIYWIHVELIYGLVVRPLHKTLSFPRAWLGVLGFTVVMVLASLLKDRLVSAVRSRKAGAGSSKP